MGNNREFNNISKKSIDMLINSTFKRHGVSLDKPQKITLKEKQELKNLVKELQKGVTSLTKTTKK
ncbi:hypothetical protein SAMN05216232_2009 [Virgibacillus subterraneus]|uniref:Spore coat protein n=1 Tax=Virgibacillus subterraneus TaxID=621109 RepID=A0A1H9EH18_9BACI|nr:hypothetical protein [Virgibacillus subterraneus]SEQ24318.1 hypothetical protein SAMN05216232_2009 [Virgibacillus subterraneus]